MRALLPAGTKGLSTQQVFEKVKVQGEADVSDALQAQQAMKELLHKDNVFVKVTDDTYRLDAKMIGMFSQASTPAAGNSTSGALPGAAAVDAVAKPPKVKRTPQEMLTSAQVCAFAPSALVLYGSGRPPTNWQLMIGQHAG